jgi:SNF2 family DNA or RNA helicase
MTLPLFQHQQASINFARQSALVFDASDPGTGKTRVAIEAFSERRVRGGGCALIICPKSLIHSAWQLDFKKFAPYLKVSCAYAKNRAEAFWADADVYVTNHDATKWLARQPAEFFDKFDTLIVDEVGAFKHHTSQRSKALNKIKHHFTYRHVMNGTPAPNTVTDIWHQMYILDDGARLGPSFFKFRSTVCTPKQVGPSAQMIKWEDRPGANDAVSKLMEDVTIRHKFEDCLDIPPNHEYSVAYQLTSKQLRSYQQMEKAQIALVSGAPVTAVNAAVVATKLLQIASGAVYDEDGTYHIVDTERYEAVIDKAEERPHVVVFFLWQHQKELLIAEAKKRKLTYCLIDGTVPDGKRHENVEYFQRGMYRICFAHPQSAAHGLTLTKGTATIWASPTYNLEHFQQGFRRIYRAGQKEKTETITFVAEDTIEEKVYEALTTKKLRMDELLEQITTEAA